MKQPPKKPRRVRAELKSTIRRQPSVFTVLTCVTVQGLATRFLSDVLEILSSEGFRAARLAVDKNHLAAIRLYEKLGFSRCGEVYKYGENFFCYERPLTDPSFPR